MKATYLTSRGVLEYRLFGDPQGEVILYFSGAHADCNTVVGDQDYLIRHGYRLLVPSRPGYGNTAVQVGESSEVWADSLIELLDFLEMEKVHVIAFSAGGRPAAQFAGCYPNRVRKLLFLSAVSIEEWPGETNRSLAPILFNQPTEKWGWKFLYWMIKNSPRSAFRFVMMYFSTLPYFEIKQRISLARRRMLYRFLLSLHAQPDGFHLDLQQSSGDMSRIQAPTLIIHSKYDKSIGTEHAVHLAMQIQGSELYWTEAEHHVLWYSSQLETIRERISEFLAT
ncbi:alpha/beta fold hydrolase [Risungbinella massiliensis]|uniref:alpha/beta fold hydrolase n=1 Tax=Risungbinella massiliensis TaxID=1329796 RepID=UPI00069A5652|nr:alpha/beta hydrolase [Risungbinella massiliensis]